MASCARSADVFCRPGPAGAPARGRLDVLPTGRNLFAIDPRSVPTRNAWEIGRRAADEVLARYAQDHGDWPKQIVLDLWGSATMRTGGDDLAQAFALIGCRPTWDTASNRVGGFEILPLAMLGRPRVDVTLRISGLFRDVFPSQIALFSAAVRAVAECEESAEDNPLAALKGTAPARVFGAAPGAYGVGLGRRIAEGAWSERAELAEAYLAATSHAYDGEGEAKEAAAAFRERVAGAEAFVHVQDLPGQDALDADAFSEHEGGFAAAAESIGARPALYHLDSTAPGAPKVRPLEQEIARSLRGRAANPRWLAGQMRHGHRGAAEIAQSLDNLYAFAALTDAVRSDQFDLMFDATLGDDGRSNLSRRGQPAGCAPHGSRVRGGVAARLLALASQFLREYPRFPAEGGRMSPIAPRRKGWCPGALRPMETGDGLLARVRASGGRLTPRQAAAIADAALACGNGAIALSARGKPADSRRQRAVAARPAGAASRRRPHRRRPRGRAAAQHRREPVERSRSGRRARSRRQPRRARTAPCRRTSLCGLCRRNSASSSTRAAACRSPTSTRTSASRPQRDAEGAVFAVRLAGDDALASLCAPGDVAETAARLARAFLARAGSGDGARAADARARRARRRACGLRRGRTRGRAAAARSPGARASLRDVLGGHVFGAAIVVGVAAPSARSTARRFKTLVERATELGATGLRLTPWRAFFIVGLGPRRAASIVATAARLGFIADAREPRLRVAVCPGAPACMHAAAPAARRRGALRDAVAGGRRDRPARQRLRQGLRAALSDRRDPDRDRRRLRPRPRTAGQAMRPRGAAFRARRRRRCSPPTGNRSSQG